MEIKAVAIVGARGGMGNLIATRCLEAGIEVHRLDRPLTPEKIAEAVKGVDMVLISVPTDAMPEVAALLAPHMSGGQIMADVCSVKVRPVKAMLAAYSGPVVGTHPLFGPDPGEGRHKVAITPARGTEAADAVAAFMERLGFASLPSTAEKHDRFAALIQGLNFVTTVSYLSTLSLDPEILDYVTPSFHRRLDAAKKMVTQDKDMFCAMFEANPFSQKAVRAFRRMLNLAAGGDVDLLAERALWWWRDERDGEES